MHQMKTGNLNLPLKGGVIGSDLLYEIEALAMQAGAEVMRYWRAQLDIHHKPDGSPVTEADHAAEAIIIRTLQQLTPEIPVIAEEAYTMAAAAGEPTPKISDGRFWLVDALDGTREFLNHNEDFTVNIALIDHNEPALGVIYHPVSGTLYSGTTVGTATRTKADGQRTEIISTLSDASLRIVSSKSYGNEIQLAKYLAGRQILEHRHRSSSIKFCEVAEGRADLYPRFGPSREWDTAAGHAIIYAAGGSVSTSAGLPLLYGKEGFLNSDFVARGRR